MAESRWNRRRALGTILAGGGASLLAAACGPGGAGGTAPAGGPSQGPATLRFAADQSRLDAGLTDVITAFNGRNLPIRVEPDVGAAVDKILTQAAAGTPPDLTHTHPRDYHAWVNAGALLPLDAYLKNDKQNVPDIVPTALDYWSRDGHHWAMPNNLSVQNVFFNKDLFARQGLKTPDQYEKEGTWTFDTYLDLARKLTTGSGDTKTFGAVWTTQTSLDIHLGFLWPFGGDLWDKAQQHTALDSKEALEAIQFMGDLTSKYGVSPNDDEWKPFAPAVSASWGAAFSAGRCALEIQPNDSLGPHVLAATFPKGNVPMPKGRAGRIVRGLAVGAHILKGSTHQDAAWEGANFQSGKEAEKIMLGTHVSLPWHASTLGTLEKAMPLLPWENAAAYAENVRRLRATPYVSKFSDITKLYSTSYNQVRLGQKTAAQVIAEIKPQIDDLLRG